MHRIHQKKFWNNVRNHSDKNLAAEALKPFQDVGAVGFNNFQELANFIVSRFIPANRVALQINKCQCFGDAEKQQLELLEIAREEIGDNISLLEGTPPKSYKNKLVALARSYARKRKCHALMHGFVCYCNEHEH